MNVYKFVKNFVCPYCSSKANEHLYSDHLTKVERSCNCGKTLSYEYPRSDSLIINYDYLQVQIHVDANESIFTLTDVSDDKHPHTLLTKHNEIPHFYDRPNPKASIIFLETLVTFQ